MSDETRTTSVDAHLMESAKRSFERCCVDPQFFPMFYQDFFIRCPEARQRFAQTDFERQHKLLRHAINLLLIFPAQPKEDRTLLDRIAERHSRKDLNINPVLYDPFVESLIQTIARFDPEFTESLELAWRATVAPGVAYMQSKY